MQKTREGAGSSHLLDGRSAAELIASAGYEAPDVIGLDEIEASRLGVVAGVIVCVAPDDYGKHGPIYSNPIRSLTELIQATRILRKESLWALIEKRLSLRLKVLYRPLSECISPG